ncbi:MAG: ABC transporter substrate-binding protein [Acidimicrobiales bacterium]
MPTKPKPLVAAMLFPAVALLAAACSSSSPVAHPSASASSQAAALPSVSVATIPVIDNLPIWLGVANGYFKQHGLNLTYQNLSGGGPATVAALQSGSVQFANVSSPVFMTATSKGVPVTSVLELDVIGRTTSPEAIFVKSDSSIRSPSQLKGATIGVNTINSLEEIRLVTEVLPAEHISQSQVHIVPIPFGQMQEALTTGEVQAVIPFEPFTTKLKGTTGFRMLTQMRRFVPTGDLSLGVFAARSAYVSSHPTVVSDFNAAVSESIAYIESHPQSAATIGAKILGLSPSITLSSLHGIQFRAGGTQDLQSYQNMASALKSIGLVSNAYNVQQFIYGS